MFADPTNHAARELQADTFEQLGYQSESATFRNAYPDRCAGAAQRHDAARDRRAGAATSTAMTIDQIFDSLAVKLKAEEVGGTVDLAQLHVHRCASDADARGCCACRTGRCTPVAGRHDDAAAATFRLARATLLDVADGSTTFAQAIAAGDAEADGDVAAAGAIFDHLDVFMTNFALVEP